MPLRRFSPPEYLANAIGVVLADPIYRRREWANRAALERFAFRRAREMAVHAGRRVPIYRERYREAAVEPASIRTWTDFERLPLMDKASVRDGYPGRSVAEGTDLDRCLLSTSSGSSGIVMTIPHRADRFWPYLLSSRRMLAWACGGRYPFWWRQAYVYTSEYPLLRVPGLYPLVFIPTAAEPEAEARLARAAARALAPSGVGRVLVRHVVRPALPDPYVAAGLVPDPASDALPARDRTALCEAVDLYRTA